MDPMLDEFRAVAVTLTYREPQIPITSTVATGRPMTAPEYWVTQVREAVRFHQAITAMDSVTTFIELGPDGVLTAQAQQSAEGTFATVSRRDKDEVTTVLTALGAAFVHGRTPRIPAGNLVDLPTYAFEHERYWLIPTGGGNATELGLSDSAYPLLAVVCGSRTAKAPCSPAGCRRRRGSRTTRSQGTVIVPGTALVDMALHARHGRLRHAGRAGHRSA